MFLYSFLFGWFESWQVDNNINYHVWSAWKKLGNNEMLIREWDKMKEMTNNKKGFGKER